MIFYIRALSYLCILMWFWLVQVRPIQALNHPMTLLKRSHRDPS